MKNVKDLSKLFLANTRNIGISFLAVVVFLILLKVLGYVDGQKIMYTIGGLALFGAYFLFLIPKENNVKKK